MASATSFRITKAPALSLREECMGMMMRVMEEGEIA
jgi:hypothetical protein